MHISKMSSGAKWLALAAFLGLNGWAHASEMTLREVVPLLETPTSLRLMEFADPTLFVDKTVRDVTIANSLPSDRDSHSYKGACQ